MAQFGVHGVNRSGEETVVIGRCYLGPIEVGTIFCCAMAESEGAQPVVVTLKVLRIVAYRRELDAIDEGLTAELVLVGIGGDLVRPNTILSTE